MFKKRIILILFSFIFLLLVSCLQIEKDTPTTTENLTKSLENIDFNNLSICTYELCVEKKLPPVKLLKDCSKAEGVSNSDCEAIVNNKKDQCSTGLCIQIIAMLTNNVDLCYSKLIEKPNLCFLDTTEYNKDVKQCENFKGKILECIKWTAKKLDSWEDCKVLVSTENRRQCAINTKDFNYDKEKRSPELNAFLGSTITDTDKRNMVVKFCQINTQSIIKNYERHIACCTEYNKDNNYGNFAKCEKSISAGS